MTEGFNLILFRDPIPEPSEVFAKMLPLVDHHFGDAPWEKYRHLTSHKKIGRNSRRKKKADELSTSTITGYISRLTTNKHGEFRARKTLAGYHRFPGDKSSYLSIFLNSWDDRWHDPTKYDYRILGVGCIGFDKDYLFRPVDADVGTADNQYTESNLNKLKLLAIELGKAISCCSVKAFSDSLWSYPFNASMAYYSSLDECFKDLLYIYNLWENGDQFADHNPVPMKTMSPGDRDLPLNYRPSLDELRRLMSEYKRAFRHKPKRTLLRSVQELETLTGYHVEAVEDQKDDCGFVVSRHPHFMSSRNGFLDDFFCRIALEDDS